MEIFSLSDSKKTDDDSRRAQMPKSLAHFEVDFPEEEHTTDVFVVTDIKQAVKNPNRVNIFINRKFEFSLDLAQVVDFKIRVGRKLTEAEVKEYRAASEFGLLYQRTLEWVLTRPHSVREVREHLIKKKIKRNSDNRAIARNKERLIEEREKYKLRTRELPTISDDDIERVISRLMERGFLNDQKFAEFFVENRREKKGISRRRLVQELRLKGIEPDVIEVALANTERSDDEEIKKMIEKKRKKYTDEKLIAYLVRQGFDYQRAKAAVLGTD